MLMLVSPENNSNANPNEVATDRTVNPTDDFVQAVPSPLPAQTVNPLATNQVSSPNLAQAQVSQTEGTPSHTPALPTPPKQDITKKHKRSWKKPLLIFIGVVLVGLLIAGAYLYGKKGERVIIKPPDPKPISLPAQAVVVNDCVAGRGKQYILPKDIPIGPIYDVINNKVIAVEYNFTAAELFVQTDRLSDTLIPFFRGNYYVEYFTITPGKLQPGQNQTETPINVAIFVVTKKEAESIKCDTSKTQSN